GCTRLRIAGILGRALFLVEAKGTDMQRSAFAGAAQRSARRSQNIVAAVVIGAIGFGLAAAASAETRGMPLIRIPPAQLPPLAAAPPTVAATPGKIPAAARALLPTNIQ